MTYTEWLALPVERRNAMCAEAMGLSQLPRGGWFRDGLLVTSWSPCTDRNHTVLMVEEVARRARILLFGRIINVTLPIPRHEALSDVVAQAVASAVAAPPDLLAWAAWSALTDHVGGSADMVGTQTESKEGAS